jgi:hypothetical protein
MEHQKPHLRPRRRRPKAIWRANHRPILNSVKRKSGAEKHSPNASEWIGKAKSSIPSIVWSLRKREMLSVTERTAQLAHLARQVRPSLTQMRGHRIPGERSNNGVGSGGLDNSGAENSESGDQHNQPGVAGANNLPRTTNLRTPETCQLLKIALASKGLRPCADRRQAAVDLPFHAKARRAAPRQRRTHVRLLPKASSTAIRSLRQNSSSWFRRRATASNVPSSKKALFRLVMMPPKNRVGDAVTPRFVSALAGERVSMIPRALNSIHQNGRFWDRRTTFSTGRDLWKSIVRSPT